MTWWSFCERMRSETEQETGRRKTEVGRWAWLLLLLPAAFGQELAVRVTPQSPLAADLARLDVEVTAPKGVLVELPDSVRLDCALETEAHDAAQQPASAGRIRYRRTYVLELHGPGECRVPPLPVLYGEARLATGELVFQVRSAIAAAEGPSPDIRDELPPVPFRKPRTRAWLAGLGISLALAAIACMVLWVRRLWGRAPEESAEARVRRRLGELAASLPIGRLEFCTGLSAILSRYLDERFRIRGSRSTSVEILAALRRMGVVTPDCDSALGALLADCDRGRYGGAHDAGGDPAAAVALCREIVDALGAQAASMPRLVTNWDQGREEFTRAAI
jgi:hypothetical protein